MDLSTSIFVSTKNNSYGDTFASMRDDIDYALLGKTCAKECISGLGPKKLKTGKYDIILDYWTLSGVLTPIIAALNADRVQKHKSMYSKKLGQQVMDTSLTIIDDRTLKKGIMTSEADGEGVSAKKTTLVKNGVLKNFMYDFLTARKEGKRSTGNCGDFSVKPSIGPSNFIVQPGKFSDEELLKQNTLLVKAVLGEHTVNPDSGSFSLTVKNGYIFDKGKLNSVRRCMISGNIFELIKDVEVGKNLRQDDFLYAPWIKFKSVQIIS